MRGAGSIAAMEAVVLRVLLIEADRVRALALATRLREQGIAVDRRAEPGASLPDAVIAPAHALGEWAGGSPPVLVIDGPADAAGRALLLDRGAADVMAAPADPVEIAARLRALVRQRRLPAIACADLSVDLVQRQAERAGKPLPLHPREFALLGHLARHQGRPVDRLALFRAVWRQRFDSGTNVVAVTVSRVRAKVDHGFGRPLIHTVGAGYMLSAEAVAAG